MKLSIALLIFVSASLYADERADYIAKLPKVDILRTIEHMQKLTKDAIAEKEAAQTQNQFVTAKLVEVQKSNEDARRLAAQAEKDMADLRAWGESQQAEAAKHEARANKEAKLAAHRGRIIGALSGVAMAFLGLTLMRFVPMPYSAFVPLAFGPIGYAMGRFLL